MPVSRTRKPKQKPREPARPEARGRRSALRRLTAALIAAFLVCVLAVGGLSALSGGGDGGADGEGDGSVQPLPSDHPALDVARRDADDPLALGEADAPVVMIEYVDFQDAFSGIHARETHDALVAEYVESGEVRIEFRNYPINGPESDSAARAAWAAGQQGRFWEFYAAALAEEFHQGSGRFDEEGARALAEEAGVADVERFAADMESDEAFDAIQRDADEGFDLGVTSTPSFMINGQAIEGARPVDEFRELLDQLIESAP
ncbi:DsbA family protein [Streptomyces radicis]|uniref:Disulfide bond formation protein DsbA n=1 Tax=Streptomyces radicis TaxID=1750517 RepID=A0A3A9W5D5_9ACTN|nr:thioredoxin domain-containing protein [Streptomyces radicis]RKN08060.1 disulfide bond formation protein DsbA [Streptomyces radicis]RKN20415.1 disulfide bond formation protein DsbA [Streptomyces radicis]